MKKLGDVCEFQRGLTYSKNDEVDFSKNVVLRSNNVDLKTNKLNFDELKYINENIVIPDNKKVKKGSLIICTANGSKSHLGKIALIDEEMNYAFGGFMGLISPKSEVLSEFLFYNLTSTFYKKFISELSDGANINNLKFSQLAEFEIPVPPLPEQQRIVAYLDQTFAKLNQAKANTLQNIQNAKELFETELREVFTNKGDGWEEKTIQEVTKVINGFAFSSKDFKPTNSIKSIKITNVGVKEFVEEADNYLPESFAETMTEVKVKEGNIVIALTRTIISAGLKVAVVPASYDGALVNQRVAAIIPNEKIINQRYLYNFLNTITVANYVLAHVNTLMQPNLSINDLKNLPVPLPNLKEQQSIVAKLDALKTQTQQLETLYQTKLNNIEELYSGILKRAFETKLIEA